MSFSWPLGQLIHFFSPGLRQCMAGRATNDELGARLHRVEVTQMWSIDQSPRRSQKRRPPEGPGYSHENRPAWHGKRKAGLRGRHSSSGTVTRRQGFTRRRLDGRRAGRGFP
jgi:hypothetical protein